MIDVLTFGETMVSFRTTGPLVSGGACAAHVAGAESNVAIALARLGHRTCWVGGIAEDALGELVVSTVRGQGVEVVAADTGGRPAGLMVLERRTADVARVAYARKDSAGSRLRAEPVLAALEAGVRRLHITGITPALSASAREATLTAVAEAARRGVVVSLDVNYRAALWSRDDARSVLADLVPHVELVIASTDELDLVGAAGSSEDDVVRGLAAAGCDEVLLKRGGDGATLFRGGRRLDAPARPVTVVDVVGAGDACAAGYLSGRLDGCSDQDCLDRAVTLGAFAVSTAGDWEGLPRRAELGLLDGLRPGDVSR